MIPAFRLCCFRISSILFFSKFYWFIFDNIFHEVLSWLGFLFWFFNHDLLFSRFFVKLRNSTYCIHLRFGFFQHSRNWPLSYFTLSKFTVSFWDSTMVEVFILGRRFKLMASNGLMFREELYTVGRLNQFG